ARYAAVAIPRGTATIMAPAVTISVPTILVKIPNCEETNPDGFQTRPVRKLMNPTSCQAAKLLLSNKAKIPIKTTTTNAPFSVKKYAIAVSSFLFRNKPPSALMHGEREPATAPLKENQQRNLITRRRQEQGME
ncbi:hypothetical protein HKBW3S03_02002, partial [Candidatus Hakubella thermalkaliphila]